MEKSLPGSLWGLQLPRWDVTLFCGAAGATEQGVMGVHHVRGDITGVHVVPGLLPLHLGHIPLASL